MTNHSDPVELTLLQAQHLWHVVATAKPVEDKVEAATALRNMAADKQNFDAIQTAVDFDHVQRLVAHPTPDNRPLIVELNALTKTMTAHSFSEIEKTDMTAIGKSLTIADNRRLDALNDIVTMIGVTPVALKIDGVAEAEQPRATPLWFNQSLSIDKKTIEHVIISLATDEDCLKLRSILSAVSIPSSSGLIRSKDAEDRPHCVYVQTSDLSTLTHEKCEWAAVVHASTAPLAALNKTAKAAQLTKLQKAEDFPKWKLNSDSNTNHKVFAYLEAHRDRGLLSYSHKLRTDNIEHKCYYRGQGIGCLVISRDDFFDLSANHNNNAKAVPSTAIGPRTASRKSLSHGYDT